jgi:hypothetical protein
LAQEAQEGLHQVLVVQVVQTLYLAQSLLLVVVQGFMPLIVLVVVQQAGQEVLVLFKLVVLVQQDKVMRVVML